MMGTRLSRLGRLGSSAGGSVVAHLQAVAFWLAILIPLGYLPLIAGIHYEVVTVTALLASIALNLFALALGHRHRPFEN